MSLYQCENCGCMENTALGHYHCAKVYVDDFNWNGKEHMKGMVLCSACAPENYADNKVVAKAGKWHGQFERIFLPKGMFATNNRGNLAHKENGDEDFRKYRIYPGE